MYINKIFSSISIIILFLVLSNNSLYSQLKADNLLFTIKSVEKNQSSQLLDIVFDYNGKETKLSELTKDKVVFLNIWGSWCGPCRREIPDIIEITKELADKDFIVVGIAQEKGKTHEQNFSTVSQFIEKNNINYINFIADRSIITHYSVTGFPTTIIFDRDGKMNEKIVGARSKHQFMQSIKRVL